MWQRVLAPLRALEMTLACIIFALLVLFISVASVGRFMGMPFIASIELTQALFVWLCVLAADLTLQRNGHFSVDLLTVLLPEALQRALAVGVLLVIAALLMFLLWYGISFTIVTSDRPLPITGIPQAFVTSALPIGFFLMLITIFEQIHAILAGRKPSQETFVHEGL